jgi:hypothetical protein
LAEAKDGQFLGIDGVAVQTFVEKSLQLLAR